LRSSRSLTPSLRGCGGGGGGARVRSGWWRRVERVPYLLRLCSVGPLWAGPGLWPDPRRWPRRPMQKRMFS
jgi:hypothetical protein